MGRFIAGIAACLLLVTGGILIWQSKAAGPSLPQAPSARFAATEDPVTPGMRLARIPNAPSADPVSKEQKRFGRADKNQDGRVTLAELIEPRRKPFAKLDLDHDGKLSFEEWAVKTIGKFNDADADRNKALTATEFATTAPKVKPKAACSCGPALAAANE